MATSVGLLSSIYSESHATEQQKIFEEQVQSLGVRFSHFQTRSCYEAVKQAATDPDTQSKVTQVLKLMPKTAQAIFEDDGGGEDMTTFWKVKSEAGYSFPPLSTILGPYMLLCGQPEVDHILDIGPGMGADSLVAAALGKQVTTIDIHTKQIKALQEEVKRVTRLVGIKSKISYKKGKLGYARMVLPVEWHGHFAHVNANKVFHFLDGEETQTMANNIARCTKEGGYVTLTFLTPTQGQPEWEAFRQRVEEKVQTPGVIFYDTKTDFSRGIAIHLSVSIVSDKVRVDETPALLKPSQKVEFLAGAGVHVMRQGRHYHTLETFMPYVQESFTLVDHAVIKEDSTMWYLSVILRKK
ncbi:MAG: class I SAM-dependent methyltransferase [Alphaproteobacteria bacterium]|nr:class I SAM-dependent methyltransferase [Alphaproteobacteria bacterium]